MKHFEKRIDGHLTRWWVYVSGDTTVHVFYGEERSVEVYRRLRKVFGEKSALEDATVNWSAYGPCSPEDARAFMKALEVACRIAEELDKDRHFVGAPLGERKVT